MKKGLCLLVIAVAVVVGQVGLAGRACAAPLEDRVAVLEAAVAQLQSEVAALKANPAVKMADLGYLKLDETTVRNGVVGPHVIFEGVNLHVQNGSGGMIGIGTLFDNPPNGLGNVIIGYDDVLANNPLVAGDRSGSHNLVIGYGNKFPGIFGLVHGYNNVARDEYSATIAGDFNDAGGWNAVIGGYDNIADGGESVVVGGYSNHSLGQNSVLIGGTSNLAGAAGDRAVICGGMNNTANGYYSVINGGQFNTANGYYSVISGGGNNTASGQNSSISGGQNNTASGNWSSVSGGEGRQALGDHDWAAGSLWENY